MADCTVCSTCLQSHWQLLSCCVMPSAKLSVMLPKHNNFINAMRLIRLFDLSGTTTLQLLGGAALKVAVRRITYEHHHFVFIKVDTL